MITIHEEAATFNEVVQKVLKVLGLSLSGIPNTPAAPSAAPSANPPITTSQPNPAASSSSKRKPGRPANKTKLTSVPSTASSVAPVPPVPAPPVVPPVAPVPPVPASPVTPNTETEASFGEMKAALQKVAMARPQDTGNVGLQRVTDILVRYGTRKIKDVKPEHYADVIADCAKV